jgi:hypothetical protein
MRGPSDDVSVTLMVDADRSRDASETLVPGAREGRDRRDPSFVFEPRAIPPAVGCRACGRRHYPDQIGVRDIQWSSNASGVAEVVLEIVCPRCETKGFLRSSSLAADDTTSKLLAVLMRNAASRSSCDASTNADDECAAET